MQKSDVVALIQSRHSKSVQIELLSMLSVSKLIVLDKGEEFIMYASASGSNYSLSVLNNGIAWLMGRDEPGDVSTVANSTYVTVVVVNGSKITLVFMHGMAEFTVADYTGVYQYDSFASEKCEALQGDLREPTDYRYLNKMSLETIKEEEIPSTVNEGIITKADLDLMDLMGLNINKYSGHYRLETAVIDVSNPHQIVKDLVNNKSILSYSPDILEIETFDYVCPVGKFVNRLNKAASTTTRLIRVNNDSLTYIIIKKVPEGGQVVVLVTPTHFYYDGPSQVIQKYEANCIVSLYTLLNWIAEL